MGVVQPWDGVMGQAQGIVMDREQGLLTGAANPRGTVRRSGGEVGGSSSLNFFCN
ncbi:hypothetical protein [Cohnella panacarvi]|uniref:hypothetical protein n=1 Tax=Cohnella panacarvi TaxID=400776 RepID=UPI0004AC60A7|nr:hypothetical protein [Cohnella panacarvi]